MSTRTAVIEVSLQRLSLLRIEHPQANPLTLACTLRAGESLPSGLTVKAEVHASRNVAAETTPLASSTVSVSADATSFDISFSSAQLNQAVAPNSVRQLWLVVYGVAPGDTLYTLAAAEIMLGWHAISQITPPPPGVALLADIGGSPWASGVTYQTNHIVGAGGSIYLAVSGHVASAATQPGTGADWQTVWALYQGGPTGSGNTILSGAGAPSNAVGSNGDFWINTTSWLIYGPKAAGAWPAGVSMIGPQGPQGPQGIQGVQGLTGAAGAAASVTVGTVTTGAAGTSAAVTNTGSTSAAVFNFTIPRGDPGAQGPQGIQGPQGLTGSAGAAATVQVGTVTTGSAGTSVAITNVGTSSAAVFNFTIPRGDPGATGPAGATGAAGAAATIAVGTVTTLPAGSSATVTNVGTSSAAVFDFGIPRGADGTSGTGSSLTIGDTPPSSPSAGQQWFNSNKGITYVWYPDGTSGQWVAQTNSGNPGTLTVPQATTSVLGGARLPTAAETLQLHHPDLMMTPMAAAMMMVSAGLRHLPLHEVTTSTATGGSSIAYQAGTGTNGGATITFPTTTGALIRFVGTSSSALQLGMNTDGGFDFSKAVMLGTRFRFSALMETGNAFYVICGNGYVGTEQTGAWPDLRSGIGLRVTESNLLELITQAGALATFQAISSGITITPTTVYDVILMARNGYVGMYVNGELVAQTFAGPTATGRAGIRVSAELTAATAASKTVTMGGITIYNGI